jgi:CheY-like chemotaxis protein
MLKKLGYAADIAGNGREAIAAIERREYDLVFMDLQMPEMDGLEATRAICARWPATNRPRIVAMTANVSASDREACMAAGMDGFTSKPVRMQDLREAILATSARVAG